MAARVLVRLALPLLVAPLALGACGGGGDDFEAPGDWATLERPGFTLKHPPGWRVETRPSRQFEAQEVTELVAEGQPTGLSIVVGSTASFDGDFDALKGLSDADTRLRLPKRRVVEESEPDVPGAADARLQELELPSGAPGGNDGAPTRTFDLIALADEGGRSVQLFARTAAQNVDRFRVRDVVRTLELR